MTPNEKEVLKEFEKVPEASAIAIGKRLPIMDIDYCQNLCLSLVRQKKLVVVEGGKWPVYAVVKKEEIRKEGEG